MGRREHRDVLQAVDVWGEYRDSALLQGRPCIQVLESLSLEVSKDLSLEE